MARGHFKNNQENEQGEGGLQAGAWSPEPFYLEITGNLGGGGEREGRGGGSQAPLLICMANSILPFLSNHFTRMC